MRWLFIILMLLGVPSSALASLTAGITPSRTSGTAPFVAHFDAFTPTDDTTLAADSDEFRDLLYVWDFDDSGSGTWAVSGQSKNLAYGPMAAHVFEPSSYPDDCAGTACANYTVSVTVSNQAGLSHTANQNIAVLDPDALTTYCICEADVSPGSACDRGSSCGVAGATQRFNSDFDNAITTDVSTGSVQFLFQKGDTFDMGTTITLTGSEPEVRIGSYGSGAKPIINDTQTASHKAFSIVTTDDLVVADLNFDQVAVGSIDSDLASIAGNATGEDVMFLRITLTDYTRVVHLGENSDTAHKVGFFLIEVDNTVSRQCGDGSDAQAWLNVRKSALMGNKFYGGTGPSFHSCGEHIIRWMDNQYDLLQHNEFAFPANTKETVTLRGCNQGSQTACSDPYFSEYFLGSYNYLHDGGQSLMWQIAPNNSTTPICNDQNQRHHIIENNFILLNGKLGAGGPQHAIASQEDDITIRNNVVHTDNTIKVTNSSHAVLITDVRSGCSPEKFPTNSQASNNTHWVTRTHSPSAPGYSAVDNAFPAQSNTCTNNLTYAPNITQSPEYSCCIGISCAGGATGTTNVVASSSPFSAAGPPADWDDFLITSGGEAADAGTEIIGVPIDVDGTCRWAALGGSTVSAGAWEYAGAACGSMSTPSAVGQGWTGVGQQ